MSDEAWIAITLAILILVELAIWWTSNGGI